MRRADGYVVFVEFDVAPEGRARFLDLVGENARRSVADEPGCRRFDVLDPPPDAADGRVALYEIYDDEAAFRAHCETPHFRAFDEASGPIVRAKAVRVFALEENAK